jgi:hypothetical protein
MEIASYTDLSSLARVVYSQARKGKFLADDVTKLVTAGKITSDEADFINGV